MHKHSVGAISLFDLPSALWTKEFEEVESSNESAETVNLSYEEDNTEINIVLYKRLLHFHNKKDISVFDRERYYHPEDEPECEEQLTPIEKLQKINKIAIILCHGGYFSGAIFQGKNVIAHKTFHHYVTRKKQGGRQSSRDKSGRRPKSGGASIRRHNEQKHQNEIRTLFKLWKHHLNEVDLIFTHLPGRNRSDFFNDDGVTTEDLNSLVKTSKGCYYFHKHDKRIRPLPFPSQRPNYTQVRAVFVKLTTVSLETETNETAPLSDDLQEITSLRDSTEFVFTMAEDEGDSEDEDEFAAPEEEEEELEESE